LIAALVASWFASYANTHIDRLIAAFKSGASGHFKERLPVHAKDEFGKLAHYFNLFMERLESYQRGMLEEIDKRREAQNAVYASEQRIKNLVRNAPVVFWAIDREGRLTFYEGALPLPVNAAEDPDPGYPLALLWSQWEEMPAHIEAVLHGQSGFVLIDKADYALEIHYNPLWTGDKTVEGAVGVVIDVTSRLQTERKLDLSEQERQKLVMAVEQGAEIVMITDRDGIIQYVNPAFERSSGYVKSEVLGKRPAILKSGRHDNRFYDTLWRTIGAGEVWSGRFTNRKKNGALYYEDATIAPLFDESGRIVHYVASKRDVTAEIDLERQLQRAERMKAIGTLAGGIAHDFNNILAGIMGFTEVCLFEAPEDSRMHQRLDKVMQACLRAKELIGHIQAFSRQDRLTPLEMMPAPIVNEAIKLVRASFPQSIVFTCDIQQVSAIRAVPAQLHQIVMNLCTNACHAMQDTGGELTVVLRQVVLDASSSKHLLDVSAGVYIQLSVSDTGHGISAAIIGQIFDPYFTTKTEDQGTGLGLSVVHGIVRKMGGAIKVDSEPGRGTTFTVLLPGIEKSGAMAEPPVNGGGRSGGQSVLVVDDEAYVLESTREALESLGYRVTACSAAADALARFQSQPRQFDLLITDFSLPGTNGARLAEDMLKMRPDLPVIISTGFSQNDSIETLARQYVVDWIHKPIIRSDLAAKVHAGLNRP
ncbi:MAG: PAS domain S-box protein, partial [Desulfatitalea sp.]|nr:PAS domain S-box protein [Desulfatitalea sp.]